MRLMQTWRRFRRAFYLFGNSTQAWLRLTSPLRSSSMDAFAWTSLNGCAPTRHRLGQGSECLLFVGPNGDAGSALSRLGDLQEHVADSQPYLHSTNLVLLAAKPGTYAMSRPNPDNTWSEVGPLAARLTNLYRASRFDADRPTLADLIGRVTDFNSVGEISPPAR